MPLRGLLLAADGLNDLGRCHFTRKLTDGSGAFSGPSGHFRLIHRKISQGLIQVALRGLDEIAECTR
jgi:hypothetical protein